MQRTNWHVMLLSLSKRKKEGHLVTRSFKKECFTQKKEQIYKIQYKGGYNSETAMDKRVEEDKP